MNRLPVSGSVSVDVPDLSIFGNPNVQRAILTVVVLLIVYVLKRVVQHLAHRYVSDRVREYRTSKFVGRFAAIASLIAIIVIWSPQQADLLTLLTVIGAGLAIAMREAFLSALGWFHLMVRAPYKQGDRIEMKGVRGDVVDVRFLHTTLMEIGGWVDADQSTGRLVHIPNSWIFQDSLYNYTHGFSYIWNELALTVTFRSDWKAAQSIILDLASETAEVTERQMKAQLRRMANEYLVHYSVLTPFVYVRVIDNGIQLTLRYLCEARRRRGTEHSLTIQILQAFQDHGGIELAYPMRGIAHLATPQFSGVSTKPDGSDDPRDAVA